MSEDPRVICGYYDAQKVAQCLAFSENRRLIALGCTNEIKIIRFDVNTNNMAEICAYSIGSNHFVTHLAWNDSYDPHPLAASYSNGEIRVFNYDEKAKRLQKIWDSPLETDPTGINYITWYTQERGLLAVGDRKGFIKFYDIYDRSRYIAVYRFKACKEIRCVEFSPKWDIQEDIESYSPAKKKGSHTEAVRINPSFFAEVSPTESYFRIWEKKILTQSSMSGTNNKRPASDSNNNSVNNPYSIPYTVPGAIVTVSSGAISSVKTTTDAHRLGVLCVAWHPTRYMVIASGSADKTIKIWNVDVCAVNSESNNSMQTSTSNKSSSNHTLFQPLLLHTISTAGEVSKLVWLNDNFLMSTNTDKNPFSGYIYIWDVSQACIPVAVLKGHCAESLIVGVHALRSSVLPQSEIVEYSNSIEYQQLLTVNSSKMKVRGEENQRSNSSRKNKNYLAALIGGNHPSSSSNVVNSQVAQVPYIISANKDGKVLVQSAAAAYFISEKISPSVAAISNQGHAAIHIGFVKRAKAKAKENTAQVTAFAAAQTWTSAPVTVAGNGKILVGMAIYSLEQTNAVRLERGAEAGVFDPALIHLLAKNYSTAARCSNALRPSTMIARLCSTEKKRLLLLTAQANHTIDDQTDFNAAMRALRNNYQVALKAGLKCRASVWQSILALLPACRPPQQSSNHAAMTAVSDPRMQLPFPKSLLRALLTELLESGDAQHFVVACEILKRAQVLEEILHSAEPDSTTGPAMSLSLIEVNTAEDSLTAISPTRVTRMYLTYIDILMKLQLFCAASDIIRSSEDAQIAENSQREVEVHLRCGRCRKEISKSENKSAVMPSWCLECRRCVTQCIICWKPVNGLLQWCPVCTHGGHLHCMHSWFSTRTHCATGCTHYCVTHPFMIVEDVGEKSHERRGISSVNGYTSAHNQQHIGGKYKKIFVSRKDAQLARIGFIKGKRAALMNARFNKAINLLQGTQEKKEIVGL